MHFRGHVAKDGEDDACLKRYLSVRIVFVGLGSFNLLLLSLVDETVSGMEDAEIVNVLHVAFLELRVDAVFLPNEVEGIQSFCLCFCDGRDVGTPRQCSKPYKVSPPVLQRDPLRSFLGSW